MSLVFCAEIDISENSGHLQDFRYMFNTVLNHSYPDGKWNYVCTSFMFFCIDDENPKKIENIRKGTHTETILIDHLKKRKTNDKNSMHVKVYSNNSPCSKCAEALLDFLNENENYRLTFYAAHLYRIIRQSCREGQEYHVIAGSVTEYDSKKNVTALGKLIEHGRCKIKAFEKGTWQHLMKILGIQDEKFNFDKKYKEKQAGDDRSRKEEDHHINQDLKHIFATYVFECIFCIGVNDEAASPANTAMEISHLVYRVNRNQAEMMQYETCMKKNLVQKLEEIYDGKTMRVNLYASKSPDSNDAKLLLKFLNEKRLANICIYVANLYGVRRNSCKTEKHYEDVPKKTSVMNSNGLRELMDHRRCEIKAFDENAWKDLMYNLNVVKPDFSEYYRKTFDGYIRSRKREDQRIKEDLECIYEEEN